MENVLKAFMEDERINKEVFEVSAQKHLYSISLIASADLSEEELKSLVGNVEFSENGIPNYIAAVKAIEDRSIGTEAKTGSRN